MFAVVTLELSKKHLVLPINWINQMNFATHAECGVNSDETHIVFHSKNETKTADFRLPIANFFDPNNDSCYLARINKFFVSKEAALVFCQNQRTILPKTYSEYKIKQAQQHNSKLILNPNEVNDMDEIDPEKQRIHDDIREKLCAMNQLHFDLTVEEIDQYQGILQSDDEDNDSLSDESEQSQLTIDSITEPNENDCDGNNLNNDLIPPNQGSDDSNHMSGATGANKSNEDDFDEIDLSKNTTEQNELNRPPRNQGLNNANGINWAANKNVGNSGEVESRSSNQINLIPQSDSNKKPNESDLSSLNPDPDPVQSCNEADGPLDNMPLREQNLITKSIDKSNVDNLDKSEKMGKENTPTVQRSTTSKSIQYDRNCNSQVNVFSERHHNDSMSSNSSSSEEIVFVPDITIYPMDSKLNTNWHATDGKMSTVDELPVFSPPNKCGKTGSAQGPIPHFFRILEPKMYAEIRKQTADKSNYGQQLCPPSKKSKQEKEMVAGTSQSHKNPKQTESIGDSILKHTMNTNHLHFPGQCTFNNGHFLFSEYNVELKYGVVDLIRGFQSLDRNSIFHDAKFVAIMLTAVIGNDNLIANRLDKSKMKFIKDTFMMRVGSDAQRLMRYSGYIEKRKDQLRKRTNQNQ